MKDLKQELLDFLESKIREEEFWAQRETWGAAIGCHVRIGAFEEVKKFIKKLETDAEIERIKYTKEALKDVIVTEEEKTAIRKQWEE